MITLGIDLASQDARTATCTARWSDAPPRASAHVTVGASDDDILALATDADHIGIDAPLGWPVAFAQAVYLHSTTGHWPDAYLHASNRSYRYRRTDLWAWELWSSAPSGQRAGPPLSVSTDRIAIPAMRAVALLGRLPDAPVPIDGTGRVTEAYPAGALRRWGFPSQGYKGPSRSPFLIDLVTSFLHRTSSWLSLDSDSQALCRSDDNAFDALLTALIARAAALGLTEAVPSADAELARREGWIGIPVSRSLDQLV